MTKQPHPNRKFDPMPLLYLGPPDIDYPLCLIDYNRHNRYLRLAGYIDKSQRTPYNDSLVVYTGGMSREIIGGRVTARGVCFGMGNSRNSSELVHSSGSQTKEASALLAVARALRELHILPKNLRNVQPRMIVIITDSEFVTRVMCDWVWQWEANDWIDGDDRPVAYQDEIELLHDRVQTFEKRGISVKFWTVKPQHNENALTLARQAIAAKERERTRARDRRVMRVAHNMNFRIDDG